MLKQIYKNSKSHDAKGISRTRYYKGIKMNRFMFFVKMLLLFSVFLIILILKDYFAYSFLQFSFTLKNLYIQEHQVQF